MITLQDNIAEGKYGHLLYPYVHQYDQMLVYKIGVDYCPSSTISPMNAHQVLDVIRQMDNISRGMPKMVYLVGWQYRGHDTGYPSFTSVNEALKRPEDSTALASLRWLMRQGPKYNTLVSLHVNFSDVYLDDNPLGPVYKDKDIIVRWPNGSCHEGYLWCDHLAYRASNYRNWHQGTFQNDQIRPLFRMIPELAMSGSLHPDAWYNTSNPYYNISDQEDCEAMREMTGWVRQEYNVDITTEFDRRRPESVDFVLFHPLLWHIAWDERTPPDPMQIPSYFLAGANAKTWSSGTETIQSKFFGEMGNYEDKIRSDTAHTQGLEKEFATRTLPWYFLNRRLRISFDGNTACFSGGIRTSYPGKYTLMQGDNILQDGNDVFIPAEWLSHKEIIAYSEKGYREKKWKLPPDWEQASSVDIYTVTGEGIKLRNRSRKADQHKMITLDLKPGEMVSIIPGGIDPARKKIIMPSGSVVFLGRDTLTYGNWKGKYGDQGFMIVGDSTHLPSSVQVKLINGADRIWTLRTQDLEALEKVMGTDRVAAARYHPLHEIIDIECKDRESHDIALYLMDWQRTGRWTVVDMIDANTRKLMNSQNITHFGSGVYLKYRVWGRVQIRLTNVYCDRYTHSTEACFSAIFFGTR